MRTGTERVGVRSFRSVSGSVRSRMACEPPSAHSSRAFVSSGILCPAPTERADFRGVGIASAIGCHSSTGSDRSRRPPAARVRHVHLRPDGDPGRGSDSRSEPHGVGGPRADTGSHAGTDAEPTPEATPEPTPAATPEPTPEPTPAATAGADADTDPPAGEPVPYLITFAPGTSAARQLQILDATGATDVEAIPQLAIRSITLDADSVSAQLAALIAAPEVAPRRGRSSSRRRGRPDRLLLCGPVVAAPDRLGRALRLGGHRRHGDRRDPRHRRPGESPRPRRRRPARLVRPSRREPADRSERPRHLDGRHRRGRDR